MAWPTTDTWPASIGKQPSGAGGDYWRAFIAPHKDEITALQLLHNQPYARHAVTFTQIRELALALQLASPQLTPESLWLAMMKEKVATSLSVEAEDFTLPPFVDQGGYARARQVFGADLQAGGDELNEALAA